MPSTEAAPPTEAPAIPPELVGAEVYAHNPGEGTTTVIHPETSEQVKVSTNDWLLAHAPPGAEPTADAANPPKTEEKPKPEIKKTGNAIWHGPTGDLEVNIVGTWGKWHSPDGEKEYLKVKGSETGIPADQVEFIDEPPAISTEDEPTVVKPAEDETAKELAAAAPEVAAEADDSSDSTKESPTKPEATDPALEKLRDSNIDPRVILKLKENLAERLQGINGADESTKKVAAIRTATRHLLAQGLPIAENGDFEPEGMEMLHAITSMMELPDWALQRLSSNKVGDAEPLIVEPDHKDVTEFIKEMNQGNLDKVEGRSKDWAPQRPDPELQLPPLSAEIKKAFKRVKEIADSKPYLQPAVKAGEYMSRAGQYSFGKFDQGLNKFLDSLINGNVAQKRRAALGWAGGALATAGSAYLAVDRTGELYGPATPAAPATPETPPAAADVPSPPSSPGRVERFTKKTENFTAKANRLTALLRRIDSLIRIVPPNKK